MDARLTPRKDVAAYQAEAEELDSHLRRVWGAYLRLGLVILGLVWAVLERPEATWAVAGLGGYLAVAAVCVILAHLGLFSRLRLYLTLVLDVFGATLLTYGFGSQVTRIAGIYFPVVIGYTLQSGRRPGLLALVLSLGAYGLVLSLEAWGAIPRAPLVAGIPEPFTVSGGAVPAFVVSALVLIASFVFLSFAVQRINSLVASVRQLVLDKIEVQELASTLKLQLEEARRLENLQRFAAGVAHDIDERLGALLEESGAAADAATGPEEAGEPLAPEPAAPSTATAFDAFTALGDLTGRLRAFCGLQPRLVDALDLDKLLGAFEADLRRRVPEAIELRLRWAANLWSVLFDPLQLKWILEELVDNACAAMPVGGSVTLRASNATLDEEDCRRFLNVWPGEFVVLTAQDSGVGMERDVRSRVFEPYFTTRARDGAVGLGLAVVWGVLRQNQAAIVVDSEPERGTTVRIFLPRAADELAADDVATEDGPG